MNGLMRRIFPPRQPHPNPAPPPMVEPSPLAQRLRPGDGLGIPLLLSGAGVSSATLIAYADPDNIQVGRPVLWLDITRDAFGMLNNHTNPKVPPVWPMTRLIGAVSTWDGAESAHSPAMVAARPNKAVTVTWRPRPGGGRVAITAQAGTDPMVLVHAAAQLGLTNGFLNDTSEEERFLRAVTAATIVDTPSTEISQMRESLAARLGYSSTQEMVASGRYQPRLDPAARGWEVWRRVPPASSSPLELLAEAVLVHRVTGSNRGGGLIDLFANCGALLSQDRRVWAGAAPHLGASESADAQTGASEYVFAEITNFWPQYLAPALVWDNPVGVLERADWVAAPVDPVSVQPGRWVPVHDWKTHAVTTVEGLAALGWGTQVAFAGGLDLFGRDAPTRVICRDIQEREDLLHMLHALGVRYLGDQPAERVVIARPPITEAR